LQAAIKQLLQLVAIRKQLTVVIQDDPPMWWQDAYDKADKYFDVLNQIPNSKKNSPKNLTPSGIPNRDSIKVRAK